MSVKARKIAIVGSRSVGKSSITVRFVEDHFIESYYPTIENQFTKNFKINDLNYNIEILDTAGQDEFSLLNEKHLIGIHGYLLIYSVTSRQSFEIIEIIRDKILNSIGELNMNDDNDNTNSNIGGGRSIPMVLVGNKSDLNYQRQVEFKEGEELAKKFNCKFLETSVRDNINVEKSFECLIQEIEKIQNPPPPKQQDKCILM
ncbi:GTP-binding protein, putative [Candida maltosa Xu316]|uniref:GTP-binding protein, putative n=1 Tax=Candida maltosa (strain Xu316) TaxID=1245528 RepID=M3IUS5_CANMX|nr:GTP-binding protein, putative [Candida maltosa Xu316]